MKTILCGVLFAATTTACGATYLFGVPLDKKAELEVRAEKTLSCPRRPRDSGGAAADVTHVHEVEDGTGYTICCTRSASCIAYFCPSDPALGDCKVY